MYTDSTSHKLTEPITFYEDIGWAGRKSGNFYYSEPSFSVIRFSYDQRQEIGDYVATVPHAQLSAAHAKLIASRYRERVDTTPVPPETKFFTFGEGDEPRLYGFVQYEVPREVQPAVDAFRELIEWMRQYPNRVIRGTAQPKRRQLSARDPLEINVRFESVGTQAVVIGNPFVDAKGARKLSLSIAAEGRHLQQFELGPEQRVVTKKPTEGDTIRLEPQQAWEIQLKKALYLTPGRYSLRLVYQSYLQYTYGKEQIGGELPMDLGEIVVQ